MPTYHVAFWNLENLFDVENAPPSRRPDKVKRALGSELAGWDASQLNQKVSQLASVIVQMNGGRGPDLLGVCEVENEHVLLKLAAALDSLGRNYAVAHHDTSDRRGIDVAFIYDADMLDEIEQFSHFIVKRTATRDLFQVNFRTASNRTLAVVGNHWPSRSGGHLESEPYRIIAGETLAYFHQRIREVHGRDTAVLAMGDFNDEPFDRSLVYHALAVEDATRVENARNPYFLNLMWPAVGANQATFYFDGNQGNVLDQFLISKSLVTGSSGLQAAPSSVQVFRPPEMVGTGAYPEPIKAGRGGSFNPDGFSDHYPITMEIDEP